MELMYLGTAAAEGVPAIFCDCEACKRARKLGGKEIRTRSGAIVDGVLKLDFSPDAYYQMLTHGLSYVGVRNILITHSHWDHFAPLDISFIQPPFSHREEKLTVWGNSRVGEMLKPHLKEGLLEFRELKWFDAVDIGGYAVTALPAVHAAGENALIYLIEKDGKSILYAHDTDEFPREVMDFLAGRKIDLISLDCTNGILEADYVGHMGITDNLRMREKLLANGAAGGHTVFVCNHFSHNGVETMEEMARCAPGFLISYDGMKINI